jgi:UDP-N-acetylmuramoyl-tripeptide--D-alanyl-D-alanine ligase
MNISELYALFQQHPLITTDSRICPENALFFALTGDTFDGNDYVEQVLAKGAAYAVVSRTDFPEDERIIRVENVLQTLQELANHHRKQLKTTVIAVTGTNGKTTTKELIAAALSAKYKILFTQGNLNNHIGVPLTLLQLRPEHEFAVIEMGANHPGEIRDLCQIAEPDFGLITNVGKAHLEGFGSFEGVIRTKTELYDFLRAKGGTIFVNRDNPILTEILSLHPAPVVYYGTTPADEIFVQGNATQSSPFLTLQWHSPFRAPCTVHRAPFILPTHLVGAYNLENVLAAICIASYFKVESSLINQAIENYIPQNNRSQNKQTEKNQLIIDAYNANPSSMAAALDNFVSQAISPQMVILGEMRELGRYSEGEHQKIADFLRHSKIDFIILVGNEFARLSSLPSGWKIFLETADLLDFLKTTDIKGFTILIKGSRSNQLEKTIEFL